MLTEKSNILVNGIDISLMVYRERRRGVRFSIVKDGIVNIRLPIMLTPDQEKEQFDRLRDWLSKVIHKKSNIVQRFVRNEYKSGDEIKVGNRSYFIIINLEDRKSHSAKLHKGTVFFNLASGDSIEGQQKAIRQLLSKIVANDFLPEISRRTHEINHLYFKKNIKSVSFKYNHSNWGSCSRTGNIIFSTRLMFAPDDVIDYVIIHELSHLLEMNHSTRFWKIVENVMPDYAEKEKWLSANSALCDF